MTPVVQTELHRHLDVSARISTLHEIAQAKGLVGQSTSLKAFADSVILREPLKDLSSVLDTFILFQKLLDRPEIIERVAFEVAEDCHAEGTRRVELRFSPGFLCDLSGLNWQTALEAVTRGITRARETYRDLELGLLCIASRDQGIDSAERTVDFFLANREAFVGLDLAGPEVEFPNRLYAAPFKRALAAGAAITIHAGEASGPDNVWEAIENLGARRIGHGIAVTQDLQLQERVKKDRICLEVCPTSNWLTQCVPSFEAHPITGLVRSGIPVSINTDDPGMFGVGLDEELRRCRTRLGMTEAEIQSCMRHAHAASFIA